MKIGRRLAVSIVLAVLGTGLLVGQFLNLVDAFWGGMGTGFLAVSALQIFRYIRYFKNKDYRESVETERKDERNRFLSERAWAWAGYLFVLICASAVIVLKLMGQDLLSQASSTALCLLLVLYWIAYLIVRKKY